MDCDPDAAQRFGELRPGGSVSSRLRQLNRWIFRRLDIVVCLDGAMSELLSSQYASGGEPEHVIVPNWERLELFPVEAAPTEWDGYQALPVEIGRASCRERVCQYVWISVVAGSLKKKK